MSEEIPIKKAALARHWGVSPPYVRKLVKEKGMPAFTAFADADAWRAANAPAKQSKPAAAASTSKNPAVVSEKIADPATTTTDSSTEKQPGDAPKPTHGSNIIDVTQFIRRDVDFDALMIEHAEAVPQVAHGLYQRACASGSPNLIQAALKNWHEAVKAGAGAREKFLELQQLTRALVPIDQVMDVVGTELQPLRAVLLKLGERVAVAANPENPTLARRVVDEAIDGIFRQMGNSIERVTKELAV